MQFIRFDPAGGDVFQREELETAAGTYIGVWALRDNQEILVGAFLGPDARERYHEWAALRGPVTQSDRGTLQRVINAYFAGHADAFEDLSIGFLTGTSFQQEIWKALPRIPFGTTCSYAGLAARIGRARSARPTGQAVGANPIPLILPCHRIVGSQGEMTGFGCGLPVKRVLLHAEGWTLDHRDRLLTAPAAAQRNLL